jgi:hypothetical protein
MPRTLLPVCYSHELVLGMGVEAFEDPWFSGQIFMIFEVFDSSGTLTEQGRGSPQPERSLVAHFQSERLLSLLQMDFVVKRERPPINQFSVNLRAVEWEYTTQYFAELRNLLGLLCSNSFTIVHSLLVSVVLIQSFQT